MINKFEATGEYFSKKLKNKEKSFKGALTRYFYTPIILFLFLLLIIAVSIFYIINSNLGNTKKVVLAKLNSDSLYLDDCILTFKPEKSEWNSTNCNKSIYIKPIINETKYSFLTNSQNFEIVNPELLLDPILSKNDETINLDNLLRIENSNFYYNKTCLQSYQCTIYEKTEKNATVILKDFLRNENLNNSVKNVSNKDSIIILYFNDIQTTYEFDLNTKILTIKN